ncbi:MAG: hypothetical protein PHN69_04535 [Candidatus Pacebacteria bacterium]|nr:hypothetical protein [Fermentimonas sp.]MDD4804421.1 hypothetical protein [Candidatus Paceibacterota bacterium]
MIQYTMVEIKQFKPNLYKSSVDILNKYFDVWQDELSTNMYKRKFKNSVLQYFVYLFTRPIGWIDFNSESMTLAIFGDVETFMQAATEIEQLGVKVVINY